MVAVEIGPDGTVVFDSLADIRIHAAADLFPFLTGKEFDELVQDIKQHGLREPLAFTPDDELLDGRNRYRACRKLGITPQTKVVDDDPWIYVVSQNLHRRHLNESQRAAIAREIAGRHPGEYDRKGAKVPAGTDALPPTKQQAIDMLNTSRGSIQRVKKVQEHGIHALFQAVKDGKVRATTAERVAIQFTTDEQAEFVRKVNAGVNPYDIAPPEIDSKARREKLAALQEANPKPRSHYLLLNPIETLIHTLEGMGQVLDTAADGLDPSITSEEAARLANSLWKRTGVARRVLALLRERSNQQQGA